MMSLMMLRMAIEAENASLRADKQQYCKNLYYVMRDR